MTNSTCDKMMLRREDEMCRRIRNMIRILRGSAVGCCAGYTLYVLWHYHRYPAHYMVQSAPWYTSILLSLGLTTVCCLLMLSEENVRRIRRK